MADDDEMKRRLARLGHAYSLEYEMIRATAAFEHAAVRPLFLLNGGALVAYLALYGALSREPAVPLHKLLAIFAMGGWIFGLVFATLCAFAAARSQFAFRKVRGGQVDRAEIEAGFLAEEKLSDIDQAIGSHGRQAECWRPAAVVLGVTSLLLFIGSVIPAFLSF